MFNGLLVLLKTIIIRARCVLMDFCLLYIVPWRSCLHLVWQNLYVVVTRL
jgi:hypothetical protein